jgi:pimeloyl-ACP methyl ester carboxylesterase
VSNFEDRYWSSTDGLKLHYRDYAGPLDKPSVICLHGLTRNARDFESLADHLAGKWRVIVPEMRGRGDSAYAKDPKTYNPVQYVRDLSTLLDALEITKFVSIGTSMGGLMTLLMGYTMPDRIAATVINDVGPELEREGLESILDYVGQGRNFPTWMHAARALEETHGAAFPDWTLDDWLRAARRVMTLSSNGRIVFDYDMKIAEPFADIDWDNQPDMWPSFDALAKRPLLVVRGEISNLLSAATYKKMLARSPQVKGAVVPHVGHAPMLDEPEAVTAIDSLLARVS